MGIERKEITRLVAKTHPENGASQRVCVKCGGRRGETLVGEYERWVDGGVKSDVWLFYFERREVVVEEGDRGMGRTGGKGEDAGYGGKRG
jgi:RimJ/RimL family protein N-acetyltransferase